ncbi:Fe-S cluster assembly protein SufD [Pararhizobium haloflavum]|uniref:Fe-S cluster assembly protein SufD n=1 Tax=Pararhizobium haloflavum TaxID=2037914 RepID=UPI000C19D023|nr:Fe-S cluster assembly protein SufD [Pararhizobium haloflavum]
MNIQTKPPLTLAEQALVDGFAERLKDLPGSAAVSDLRDRLIGELKDHGLPTRRIESWHYTDFRVLLKSVPEGGNDAVRLIEPLVPEAIRLVAGADAGDLPAGLKVSDYADALRDGRVTTQMEPRGADDAIGRISGAFVSCGLGLDLAAGTALEHPVELQVAHGGGHTHQRFPVRIGANAAATVIERHTNRGSDPAFVTSVTDLVVGNDANLTWIIVQTQGGADTHLSQINVTLEENARLTLYVVNAGGKLVREEIHVVAKGEGADLQLRGVNLLDGDSHTDVTLTLGHDVPNTTSTETFRNVVFDRARGVFQGQIRVAQDAQKTDARMASNTLLLSDDGEFSTKPELEIFADDVQCAHGATVADIDDVHLFYLMSRGIPEPQARGLLVKAFVNEIVEELEDEPLVEALHDVIETWLERHG